MSYCYSCMTELPDWAVECPKCHAPVPYVPADPRDLRPGTILRGRFIVGRSLGHGGFGITYIAYDTLLKTLRAIKEFYPNKAVKERDAQQHLIFRAHEGENVKKYEKHFQHEAEVMNVLCILNHVPNVVGVFDLVFEYNTRYIVMEYLDGCTLDEYLILHGVIPWRDAIPIALTVLHSLSEIHSHGLIHRDVSMSNVFRLKNGEIRLIDFGSAIYYTGPNKDKQELIHAVKPGYSPIEQIKDLDQGPWTDVYAMGVTLFKMIVGHIPPQKKDGEALPPASKYAPGIPAWLDAVLIKATQPDTTKRYRTANEFAQALEGPSSKRKKLLAIGIPTTVLALVAVLAALLSSGPVQPVSNPLPTTRAAATLTATPFHTPSPTSPPTATPLPQNWTGSAVYMKGDSDQNNDLFDLQFSLKDMGYIALEDCGGVMDDPTIRAISAFCVENNVDFDGQTLDPLLRYAICTYQSARTLPDGLEPLTEAHRKLLTPLGALTLAIVPAPNEAGYIGGSAWNISLEGKASPNQRIEILLNGARLSWTNSDLDGNWSYHFPSESLLADQQNTVIARYEGQPDLQAQGVFIYKPDTQPIVLSTAVQEGDTFLTGTAEALSSVTLSIDGMPTGQTTASANGDFAFDGFVARAGSTLVVMATDVAGNRASVEQRVQEETRAELTMRFQNEPEAGSITAGLYGVTVFGTAHAGKTVSVMLNGQEQASVVSDAQGEWNCTLSTETLAHASVNTITARYADGLGGIASLALVIDAETAVPIVLGTLDEESASLTGIAEAGASITLEAGGQSYSATADDTGRFEIAFAPQPAGETLSLTSRDAYGNASTGNLSVRAIELSPITVEGAYPLYVGPNRNRVSLRGTAQPGQTLILSLSGSELASLTADADGQWECSFEVDSTMPERAHDGLICYERKKEISAAFQLIYDASITASLPDSLYEEERVLQGTCEPGATVTARLSEGGSPLGTVTTQTDVFSLALGSPVKAGDEILLTVEDKAGNQLTQTVTVKKSLPKYAGGFEFPADGTSFTSELSISAWMLCSADVQGRVVLEGEGHKQQLPMYPCDEDTLARLADKCETPVQAAIGWKLATRIKMDDYDLPPGSYTLTLYAIVDGEESLVASRQAFYGDADMEATGGEEKALSYSVLDEEIGYAFGIDDFHRNRSFDPKTVVLSGYFYAPEGSTFTMAYNIDGTDYVESEMKKLLGGKPAVYRSAGASSSISGALGEESLDMSTAAWALSLNLSNLENGSHTIQLTVFITLPNAATQIVPMKSLTITTAADGETFSSKTLKNGLNQ